MRCLAVSRGPTIIGYLKEQAMATVSTASRARADSSTSDGLEKSALERIFDLDVIDKMTFRGHTPWYPFRATGTFGGQAVGQALMAAGRTLEEEHSDKMANSVHAYFVRPGDLKKPIVYEVEVIRDGKSFSTRRVQASQDGVVFCTCMMSFQRYVDGPVTHQIDMPTGVPPPEGADRFPKNASPEIVAEYRQFPPTELDIREVTTLKNPEKAATSTTAAATTAAATTTQAAKSGDEPADSILWMRTQHGLQSSRPLLHQCVLAYLSDLRISGTGLRRHRSAMESPDSVWYTSLDHSLWFQGAPVKADDWLLYVMESPVAGTGRGFNLGRMYTRDGRLVLNAAQDAAYRASKL